MGAKRKLATSLLDFFETPASRRVENPFDAWHGGGKGVERGVDPERLGTGEGAYIAGPGFYASEARPVGAHYRGQYEDMHKRKGALYKLQLHLDPARMGRLERPLHEQPSHVANSLFDIANTGNFYQPRFDMSRTMAPPMMEQMQLEEVLRRMGGMGQAGPTRAKMLRQELEGRGVQGLEFIGDSSGVKNFVVFDPELVTILKRYGLPVALAPGATAAGGLFDAGASASTPEPSP